MKFISGEKYVLGNMLEEAAHKYKNRTYFIFEGRSYSYREVNDTANRVASGFANIGVKKGDHVAILMENCPEFVFTWFGLARIGAVEAPFNPFHKGSILEYLINYSDAEILVISSSFIDEIASIEGSLKSVKKIIISGAFQGKPFKGIEAIPFSSLLEAKSSPPHVDVIYKDIMALMFTSGTTGPSKGVLITHNQGFFVASQYLSVMGIKGMISGYCYIPLFHEAPQFGIVLGSMFYGGNFVLTRGFSPADFWDDIRKYNCTVSGMFEVVIKILLMAPERPDDADNPMQIFSTAHISPESQLAFEKRFGVKLVNTYGLTEGDCTIVSTYNDIVPGSFGKPRGYFEAKLFDANDREVARGATGELVLRSKQPYTIFEGYYKMPEKTLTAWRNLWWHTGDLAYQDKNGYFFFVGRDKDMIRRGDENISALEVEKVVESHPDIKECAAVAAYSEIWGEEVKLAVVCREGRTIHPAELIAFCDERMAYFMVPRYIEFVETIPRTGASGRPVKDQLKQINKSTWDRQKAGVKIAREKAKKK
ncbi:MAG: AMP-binding protein [Dehalococcoidia bacterium]|nr:AMP-binding protein [Dehalococcoidia bacterium]MDD5494489.1 AMP-binding protein [Dehalococcoidia bacterium]